MTEDEIELMPIEKPSPKAELYKSHLMPDSVLAVPVLPTVDKINNLQQKEYALNKAGVTREKYMKHIADSLVAVKWVDEPDVQGNIRRVSVPDVARRNWATEMTARLKGDMVEHKVVENNTQTSIILIRSSGDSVGMVRRGAIDAV